MDLEALVGQDVWNEERHQIVSVKFCVNNPSKRYIILEDGSKYIYPDSFLQGFLRFDSQQWETEIKKISERIECIHQICHKNCKKTNRGVMYLYDYYPQKINIFAEDEIREDIWNYKSIQLSTELLGKRKDCYEKFTNDFFNMIVKFVYEHWPESEKVYLLSIPSSKVHKLNTVCKSIKEIVKWSEQGKLKDLFNLGIIFLDGSSILQRVYDIDSEKVGNRSLEEHMDSIQVRRNFTEDDYIILLDDITTTGTIMTICTQLLEEKGAQRDHIGKIALAKSISR